MTSIIIWQKEVSSSARKHSKSFVDACRWCQGPLGCSEHQESQRKRKWLFCSKHQELERKGKWLNLNAFFNSWKCLFWIFENILLLSLGSTYIQRGDHTEGYEMCGCVCGGGYCGEIRIRVETNTHPYEGKYCLPGGGEICVGQYLQYIHYARRPHLFFLEGIKGTVALITIIIKTSFVVKSITTNLSIQVQ